MKIKKTDIAQLNEVLKQWIEKTSGTNSIPARDDSWNEFWHKVMNETVTDTLKRIGFRTMITEMAFSLKDYRKKVDGLKFQLVENWCLCKYCQMFNPPCENRVHWTTELRACLNELKLPKLKAKTSKQNILDKLLVEQYEFNDENVILSAISDKFDEEQIMDVNQRKSIVASFANGIHDLIDAISNDSIQITAYIQETFGNP